MNDSGLRIHMPCWKEREGSNVITLKFVQMLISENLSLKSQVKLLSSQIFRNDFKESKSKDRKCSTDVDDCKVQENYDFLKRKQEANLSEDYKYEGYGAGGDDYKYEGYGANLSEDSQEIQSFASSSSVASQSP